MRIPFDLGLFKTGFPAFTRTGDRKATFVHHDPTLIQYARLYVQLEGEFMLTPLFETGRTYCKDGSDHANDLLWLEDNSVNVYAELEAAQAEGKQIQLHISGLNSGWRDVDKFHIFNYPVDSYRIKPEIQYGPWTPADVPPLCWLKRFPVEPDEPFDPSAQRLVTQVSNKGIKIVQGAHATTLSYDTLFEHYLYSTDRVFWQRPQTITRT